MRDNDWLRERLYHIWENYFADVPRKNRVIIKFGKKSYRQLGCIRWAKDTTPGLRKLLKHFPAYDDDDKRISLIMISSYFKDSLIPDIVVEATVAHELCHYAHGFNSPLNQIYKHPHKGRIIEKELTKRGLAHVHRSAENWLKSNWEKYIRSRKAS